MRVHRNGALVRRVAVPDSQMMVFTGNANPELAAEISSQLNLRLGKAVVGQFSDGEVMTEIQENVRGRDVFVVQPTCAPTNDNLLELLVMIDALRWASAKRITAVIPYFGYARQDRRPRSARVPITARLVAKMIGAAGADRVLTMDLHADQIQGFFDIPVDNVYASPILLGDIWKQKYPGLMVVSPDVGGVVGRGPGQAPRRRGLAIIDKRRPKPNEAKVMNIIGDVRERSCVLIDDLVDTAGTLCQAAGAEGARCGQGGRLLHPPGALRAGGGQHCCLPARRAGGHQHHPAERGRRRLREDPPAEHRRAAGRDHAAGVGRGVRQLPVRRLIDIPRAALRRAEFSASSVRIPRPRSFGFLLQRRETVPQALRLPAAAAYGGAT
jgi:ribose-phosphate pyrophosphokinase